MCVDAHSRARVISHARSHVVTSSPSSLPLQNVDGVNYLFTKKNGIYFVSTTKFNVSPSFILELLERVAKVRPHRPSTRAANSLSA